MCHRVKHIGFWGTADGRKILEKIGLTEEDFKEGLINHFCKVNNCTREDFKKHVEESFRIWSKRSKYEWKQDFGEYDPNR
ncbi:hypothetical protein M1M92_00870 [Peptococcaceae bacterium]|nr:hypothetical protein [Peptococcaceae bacterium]